MKNFNPDRILETASRNISFILERELECGVPLNYIDDDGQYVFRYRDGTVLPASFDLSFEENCEAHKRIMGDGWTGI